MSTRTPMASPAFIKMHGLGNDFVIIDARARPLALSERQSRLIADRRRGIGCDQLIVLEPAQTKGADVFMRIRNADGSESGACGNATRCVGRLLFEETGRTDVVIETTAGLLGAHVAGPEITIDMGVARTGWADIPLARETDTLHMGIAEGPLSDPVGVNVGNPHAVFFVTDAAAIPLAEIGPRLEHHPLFPERANIEAVEVLSRDRLRVRVWERGAGLTLACGTGACAAVIAAARRGLAERKAVAVLDGGELAIEWRADGHVIMTGPAAESFRGHIADELLA
jgi:diaminopimelate epimerase